MLDNLSEHKIEALSNLLRGNDCFISQPTGSGKSAVYQTISIYFLSLYMKVFSYFRSNDVYVEPKTQEIVISNM
jgi:predicted ATP-binding protein involved in virulence